MPRNYKRLELRLRPELRSRLENLKKEFEETSEKHISMTEFVNEIIESYLNFVQARAIEEEKS